METVILVAIGLSYPQDKIESDKGLYLAAVGDIMKSLFRVNAEIDSRLLIRHNPGLTDLANYFGLKLDNLPTALTVCLDFDTLSWKDISPKNVRFQWIKLTREL